MATLSERDRRDLLIAARQAAAAAYVPYSRFRVGAAVLGAKGTYAAANVENASYGLSLCAERAALAASIAAGDRNIRAVAVACVDADDKMGLQGRVPCGACRQWLAELAPEAEILIDGADRVLALDDLLPLVFRLGTKGDC